MRTTKNKITARLSLISRRTTNSLDIGSYLRHDLSILWRFNQISMAYKHKIKKVFTIQSFYIALNQSINYCGRLLS